MSKSLIEAGLKLASSKKQNSHKGSIHIDRTIYHTVQVTDSQGKFLIDGEGNSIVINTVYVLAGSWLSPQVHEIALQKEKEFSELNKLFRDAMDAEKNPWRITRRDQVALNIQGIT